MIASVPPQAKRLVLLFVLVFLIVDALFFGLLSHGFHKAAHSAGHRSFQGRTHLYSSLPGRPRTPPRIAIVTHHSADGCRKSTNTRIKKREMRE